MKIDFRTAKTKITASAIARAATALTVPVVAAVAVAAMTVAAVTIAAITLPAMSAPNPTEAWSFMAFSAPYGRFKATTTCDTTMVDNGVFRYSLKGPNFDLFKVLNPENKSYIQTTVSQYSTQWAPSIKYPPLKKIGNGKMLKLDCLHYLGESFRPGTIIDAWFTNAIPMDTRLSDSFCKLCGLPTGYGLPVKVQFKTGKEITPMFELLKIEKTQVVVETLLVPKSYRFMKDQALFFFSDEDGKNSGIDEMMRSKPLSPSPPKNGPSSK